MQINLPELSQLLRTEVENEAVDALSTKLRDHALVDKELQNVSVISAEARALIEEVISRYRSSAERLGTEVIIAENKVFESAIFKIQSNNEKDVSVIEARCVKGILLKESLEAIVPCDFNKPTSLPENVLKRMQSSEVMMESKSMELRFILSTTNICERLFSMTGFAFSYCCQRFLPSNLEGQMYLHINYEY